MSQEKPLTEKSAPTLFIPKDAFGETKPKNKYCTKSIVSKVLAILLFALLVTLVVECLFPVIERKYHTIDVIEVFDENPVDVKILPDSVTPKNPVLEELWHLNFLINPTRLCDTIESPETQAYARDPEVKLLMLVPSATDNFAQRDAIRKTWGSLATKSHGPIRLGFVLGSTPNATETSRIGEESERYGDIIQADIPDTNRTAKSVLMLKWISMHCPHAEYFLKANDDTFVNLDVLQAVTRKDPFASGGRFIGGFIHRGVQPSREPHLVSEMDHPSAAFPPYVSGSSYLTTGPTASRLFEASKGVKPLLPMEDVYVTGLCAEEIEANRIHEPCFRDEDIARHSSWDTLSSLATVHSVSPEDMDKLWNDMTKAIYDAIHYPDEGFPGQPESSLERIKPLFDLGSLFDWADDMEEPESISSSDQSVDFESGFNPIAELIDDLFDLSKDQSDSTDSSGDVQGPSDGLMDMNSLLRNLLVNNRFSIDGKNSNPLGFGSNPNQHIIIGSIRSRVLLPDFEDNKNDDVSDFGISPIQRIFMNFGRSGFMSPSLNTDTVDSRLSNSQSSFMSPSVEYNSRDPLNIRRNLNVLSQSSHLSSSFDANNMKQIPNQNIMSSIIQSGFRAPGLDRVLNAQGVQQSQQDLPDWPGSQKALEQLQTTRLNLPMRWQKTFIIPLPLDQAGGRGMNLTEYFPQ